MDGNNGQSGVETDPMAKLEEDLQKLTHETDANMEAPQPVVAAEPSQAIPPTVEPIFPPEVPLSTPVVPETPKKGSPMLIISLGLVVVALLVAIAYVVGMKYFSSTPKQVACTAEAKVCEDGTSVGRSGPNCEFDACPVVSATPEATPDPTANWKTYMNGNQGFSFKFPDMWVLDAKGSTDKFNASVKLTKGTSFIQIYANMDGLGGQGVTYQGTPVVVSGLNLYKYQSENTFGKTIQVGVTDQLTNSLGVFMKQGKYYSIFLTYPSSALSQTEVDSLKTEYDQILSTFKFIEATPSGSPTSSPSATPTY